MRKQSLCISTAEADPCSNIAGHWETKSGMWNASDAVIHQCAQQVKPRVRTVVGESRRTGNGTGGRHGPDHNLFK